MIYYILDENNNPVETDQKGHEEWWKHKNGQIAETAVKNIDGSDVPLIYVGTWFVKDPRTTGPFIYSGYLHFYTRLTISSDSGQFLEEKHPTYREAIEGHAAMVHKVSFLIKEILLRN